MATEKSEWNKEFSYKGDFLLDQFIELVSRWLKSKGFVKSNEDLDESYYMYEELPDGSVNLSFIWKVENKSGDFVKRIEIRYTIVALKKAEIIYNNQKINVDVGEIGVALKGNIEFDPDEKLINTWWKKKFYDIFWKPKYGAYFKSNKDDFFKDLDKLYSMMLAFFEIEGSISDIKIRVKGYKE
ncbi:MAG: hypothetical protein QXR30_00550 [Candidatus Woesearchaeota archaeon]